MCFNEDSFIKLNKENCCENADEALKDFLYVEVYNYNYQKIIELLLWENIRCFCYEGNQYSIEKRENVSHIISSDEVALEHGASDNQARFRIAISDLIELLEREGKKSKI